jgi:hypothetical protein
MKRFLMVFLLMFSLVGLMTVNSEATQITGDISFSGGASFNATDITFSSDTVTQTDGDYSVIPDGTPVTFQNFTFGGISPDTTVTPLWNLSYGGIIYGLIASSISIDYQSSTALLLSGLGTATMTGRDDTAGTWNITANRAGRTFSFSASSSATAAPVPEPATMLLMGTGLAGLIVARRRKAKKN